MFKTAGMRGVAYAETFANVGGQGPGVAAVGGERRAGERRGAGAIGVRRAGGGGWRQGRWR